MEAISTVAVQAFHEGIRRLGESHVYDPVKGTLFENESFDVWMLAVVTVLVIGLGSLAAGAGIGGGGLFVPLFAFVLGVGAKAAVPMSKATILGGACGNMMSLAFARHPDPDKNRPLIDYEASTFMQSGELLGVVFGVLLNLILPEIMIIVFLAVLLSFNAYKTLQKGVAKYKDESKKMAAKDAKQIVDASGALEADIELATENPSEMMAKDTDGSEGTLVKGKEGKKALFKGKKGKGGVENALGLKFQPRVIGCEACFPYVMNQIASKLKHQINLAILDVDMARDLAGESASTQDSSDGPGKPIGRASLELPSPDKLQSPTIPDGQKGKSLQQQDGDDTDQVDIDLISPELKKLLDEEGAQFPLWAWSLLAPMTIFTVFYAIVKKSFVSTCGPVGYWLWYFTPVPVLGVFMYATARILKKKHNCRVEAGYVFHGDGEDSPDYRDLKWTDATLRQYPLIAVLAGVAAGLLGIGGGMVIGPLFIQLDMQPKVGSSSCAFMILWTAFSGVVQYAFAGKIGWQFIAYGVCVGFVSGQIGQRGVDRMLKKSGRPSYVIFLLGGIVLVACIAMTCTGTYKFIKGVVEGDDLFAFDTYDLECHQ